MIHLLGIFFFFQLISSKRRVAPRPSISPVYHCSPELRTVAPLRMCLSFFRRTIRLFPQLGTENTNPVHRFFIFSLFALYTPTKSGQKFPPTGWANRFLRTPLFFFDCDRHRGTPLPVPKDRFSVIIFGICYPPSLLYPCPAERCILLIWPFSLPSGPSVPILILNNFFPVPW